MAPSAASGSASGSNIDMKKEKKGKESNKRSIVHDNDPPAKRAKSPGIRLVGSRIYDSENGKTCHQCRQKTRDFVATCKNQKGKRPCTMHFCHKCLLNRYGENAEKMEVSKDWDCPKCREICNCSFCMKKRGHNPTGIMIHAAKSTGFNSVSEMLQVNGPDNTAPEKNSKSIGFSPQKKILRKKATTVVSPKKRGKENSLDGSSDPNLSSINCSQFTNGKKHKKAMREGLKELHNENRANVEFSRRTSPRKIQSSEAIFVKITKENCKDNGISIGKKKMKLSDKICDEVKNAGASISKKAMDTIEEPSNSFKTKYSKDKNGVSQKYGRVLNAQEKESAASLKEFSSIPFQAVRAEKGKDSKSQIDAKVSNAVKNKDIPADERIRKCGGKIDVDIPLPLGASLTSVAGINLPIEDIGQPLQFLEFCANFGKVLNLKKGYGESLLRELTRERRSCRMQDTLSVRFQIQVLSLILKNIGEESPSSCSSNEKSSWLKALKKCTAVSSWALSELPSDYFDGGGDCYDKLSLSTKLRLLNYLCDEALSTVELRNWIEDQNSKFVKCQKEAKEKVVAVRDKEKLLKQKLQDEVATAIISKSGASLSISEYESIVLQIKSEVAQAKAEKLSVMGMVPTKRRRSDAVRTEPIFLDNGRAFWKLKTFNEEECILLQDMGTGAAVATSERWFMYKAEQKQEILDYISSLSLRRSRMKSSAPNPSVNGSETSSTGIYAIPVM